MLIRSWLVLKYPLYDQSQLYVVNGVLGADVGENSVGAVVGYDGKKGQIIVGYNGTLELSNDIAYLSSLIVGSEPCNVDTSQD